MSESLGLSIGTANLVAARPGRAPVSRRATETPPAESASQKDEGTRAQEQRLLREELERMRRDAGENLLRRAVLDAMLAGESGVKDISTTLKLNPNRVVDEKDAVLQELREQLGPKMPLRLAAAKQAAPPLVGIDDAEQRHGRHTRESRVAPASR